MFNLFTKRKRQLQRARARRAARRIRKPADKRLPAPVAEPAAQAGEPHRRDGAVLVLDAAYDAMIADARDHPRVETGGLLVGAGSPPVVLVAGAGGANAIREPARFSSDPAHDAGVLTAARERWGELAVACGHWHRHPDGMTSPSAIDRRQACDLGAAWDDGRVNLVGIVTRVNGGEHALFLYGQTSPRGELAPLEYEIVPKDHARVQSRLASAVHYPEPCEAPSFWLDPEFQSYQTPRVRRRLAREIAEVRWRFGGTLESYRLPADGLLRLDVHHPAAGTLTLVLPPEYPLNPPRLFRGEADLSDRLGLGQWNSTRSLASHLAAFLDAERYGLEL